MLSSEKIKSKTFNRAIRGYNPEEVEKYLEFLGEKFDELVRENGELVFKLASIPGYSDDDEESGEQMMISARASADKIIADAEADAQLLYNTAKENTEKQLKEFRAQIAKEALIYRELKKCVDDLKESIYNIYRINLERIEEICPKVANESMFDDKALQKYLDGAIEGMKTDIAHAEMKKKSEAKQKEEDEQVKIRRTREFSTSSKFKIATVKDTIRELNKQMLSGEGTDAEGENE